MAIKFELVEWLDSLRAELRRGAQSRRRALSKSVKEGQAPADAGLTFVVKEVSIEVELSTERSRSGDGALKFWVVQAGAQARSGTKSTQKVRITLDVESDVPDASGDGRLRLGPETPPAF
ncbi:hypothetical protein BE04_12800 [Sorangium cellulosum]|uniref:Trypsin-co-occurring domain-containing protein n=2 Tax=Sorangium cellulosum TaxID=56 RepID=A0A150PVB4_SORCE|nr:trypco2 family protein [Sorangium cellulosum]AGP40943.1 hypothetical protein SCE1572_44505 [Sorangium cellulosum So0157-2]KYF59523.1 hypothetical protein BE04_12800 [Sorangium cellulosum]